MRHHILPEKLYNILVINQTNLFIQKDDEVRNKFGASVKHVTKTTDRRIYHCRNPQGGSNNANFRNLSKITSKSMHIYLCQPTA